MSPGNRENPRNTGALPKSNRRIDRNRSNRAWASVENYNWLSHDAPTQHMNNLFQYDWRLPVGGSRGGAGERRNSTKNSNNAHPCNSTTSSTRSTSASQTQAASSSLYDFGDYGSYNSRRKPEVAPRSKMTPPVESRSRTQSPQNHPAKPTNTDKMPERGQVEGRLNQIREYIKVTSTMMDSLSQSSDPRAQVQHEKLRRMVDDLYDSEQKLSKLMEDCQKYWTMDENGDLENEREQELRKKVEESQIKLAQLQEHQAHLVGMQLQMRERLNEARKAQQEHQAQLAGMRLYEDEDDEDDEQQQPQLPVNEEQQQQQQQQAPNAEQLQRETEALRDKLMLLESKKKQMDHLVQELNAVEMADRASCSSEGSRSNGQQRDKQAELEAMKAQLSHLKALMNEATGCEDDGPSDANPYQVEAANNSYNEFDESIVSKASAEPPPSVEQIQAVTRELKEQQQMLQAARAELRQLKRGSHQAPQQQQQQQPASSTPSPSIQQQQQQQQTVPVEKKQSNHDARHALDKRRQIEDFMRKDQYVASDVNQNGAPEWDSRRSSNSHHSHMSTPANLWPPPANLAARSHAHSVDGISAADHLLETASQLPVENSFGGNFWGVPAMLTQQPMQGFESANVGSAEYYKQLLLNSQAQQLQMMSTTIQQCCQLLWAQQREIQSMKSAITHLQTQLRYSQSRTSNNLDPHDDQHSNLGRAAAQQQQQQQLYGSLDVPTLPPSSSLPNLVSLPNPSPATPTAIISSAAAVNSQQQQQLNNQVPPGNRANNYWDNFRSYSRQNLLSGSSKCATDCVNVVPSSSSAHSGHPAAVCSHVNKSNRHQSQDNLPPSDSQHHQFQLQHQQYQLQLQHQQQHQHQQVLQQQDSSSRSNCLPSCGNIAQQLPHQQQSESDANAEAAGFREDESVSRIAKQISERDDLRLILMHCLKALESRRQNESPLPSSNVSNTTDSSDDESEAGDGMSEILPNSAHNSSNPIPHLDLIEPARILNSTPQFYYEAPEFHDAVSYGNPSVPEQYVSSSTQNNLENSCEADQTRPEIFSTNNRVMRVEENGDITSTAAPDRYDSFDLSMEMLNHEDEHESADYVMLNHSRDSPRVRRSPSHHSDQCRFQGRVDDSSHSST